MSEGSNRSSANGAAGREAKCVITKIPELDEGSSGDRSPSDPRKSPASRSPSRSPNRSPSGRTKAVARKLACLRADAMEEKDKGEEEEEEEKQKI